MWILVCVLLFLESTDAEAHKHPVLVARHTRYPVQVEFDCVFCDVEAIAFDDFVTDQVTLEYRNAGSTAFDTLEFAMPIVSGTSIEKCEFYLEKQLCASISYVEFAGAAMKDGDAASGVICKSNFAKGVFSACIEFPDESRSCTEATVKVCWSQRPSVFCSTNGVPEKQYVFPRQSYCRCIRPAARRPLSGLIEKVSGSCSFTFSIDTRHVERWSVTVGGKWETEDGKSRLVSSRTDKDIVCVFTPKEHSGLLVRHFRFQTHYVLEVSAGLSESTRFVHTATPREVVFVVDVSRNMNECRHATLIEVLERLLEVIKGHKIYVNVVCFNSEAKSVLDRSMRICSSDDVQALVKRMKACFFPRGGRNVVSGLTRAASLERVQEDGKPLERNVVLIASGVDGAPDGVWNAVQREARNGVRFFAVGVGKTAPYDVLAEIARLGCGSCDVIQRARDTGDCLSAMLEKTGSQGHEYDFGSLEVEDRCITSFIVKGRLCLDERPVQVPLRRHEPRVFTCDGFKTYLVFKHGAPDRVEVAIGEERHTCHWSDFKMCESSAAEKVLAKDFVRHVNREFYLLVHKVFCYGREGCRFGEEDTSKCLVALTNILSGDALLVDYLSSEQKNRLFMFAEKYIGRHNIYDKSMHTGVFYSDLGRSAAILTELLRAFDAKASFKASVAEMQMVLRSNGVDALAVERIVRKCRERARERRDLGDACKKLLVLSEAIKLALGPLNRECASAVSYKSAAIGKWCAT